jgi:DNA-binding LacI/PurR family transcriptional regulator
MVNVLDVAERANVSSATVSRVLTGSPLVRAETRDRVIAAAEALGYQPNAFARSLRKGRGSSIALVTGDIEHGIYPALAKHLQRELELTGFSLVLFNLDHQQERLRHMLKNAAAMGLRGLFLASADIADMAELRPLVERAKANGIAILSVSQRLERYGIDSIVHDDRAGAEMAVRHMLERGRTAIAYLGRITSSAVGGERAIGYERALREAGVPVDPGLVWNVRVGFRGEAGYRMTNSALDCGVRFDAIVAASDELASGAIAALHDHGLSIPGDVAVTGFGGIGWGSYIRPALSTIDLDIAAMAERARHWLEALESGEQNPPLVMIRPTLVVRGST